MARITIRDTHPIMYECENCGSEVKSADDEENIYPSFCSSCGAKFTGFKRKRVKHHFLSPSEFYANKGE